MNPSSNSKVNPTISAIIVTNNRIASLTQAISLVLAQTQPIIELIIIDNANDIAVKEFCADLQKAYTTKINYIGSKTNLGGAGGFALGILLALTNGSEYIWLADDDGKPENDTVLAELYECLLVNNLEEVSPLVCDIDNPEHLAFPLRQNLTWVRKVKELQSNNSKNFLPSSVSLFNGALFTAKAIAKVGVPDLRLFVRGDEVEIFRRLRRAKIRYGTCLNTKYLHPAGGDEFIPILGGKLHAQYPSDTTKRFYTYRNRGYLLSQPGLRKLIWQEYLRFGWFFLVKQRSLAGFKQWYQLHKQGRKEKF